MKKRKGILMLACRQDNGNYHLHSVCMSKCLWQDSETSYTSRAWPGPMLKPGEGPVRVRVTIERERSKR